ncbi:hypothetical protein J2X69_000585 [Algoriphagus sp. 4150]|nr:hypothetical protein [Algoriphagus sp. 4150]
MTLAKFSLGYFITLKEEINPKEYNHESRLPTFKRD